MKSKGKIVGNTIEMVAKIVMLRREYRRQVELRTRKFTQIPVMEGLLTPIAEKLKSTRLASLFVESQFHSMPSDWCKDKFGVPYPPANVVFSSNGVNWDRYENYISGNKNAKNSNNNVR